MKIDHYNENGQPCDKHGMVIRKPENVIADGESVHVSMQFMDSAQRAVHDAFNDDDDNAQTAFEQRISDAWKNSPTNTANTTATHADSAAAYEQRICNAWKTTPADLAA